MLAGEEGAVSWWIVMELQSWDSLSLGPYRVGGLDDMNAPAKWIAVFDDRAKAEAWANGRQVVEVRTVE